MTQYDAGPGDWSDREWESPDKKPKPHARRRRVALPPWALLAILIAFVILVCVGLVLLVRSCKSQGEEGTPTPTATTAPEVVPSSTRPPTATIPEDATATVVLPIGETEEVPAFTEIAPGATVVVQGTTGAGLNLRAQPTTEARLVGSAKEGDTLTVVEGPEEADGYVWWKLRTADGKEGWGAADWLVLKTEQ